MERTPETELMSGVEQAEAYARANFAEVNARFVNTFVTLFPWFDRGTIVDLGCGPADIAIRLARALPHTRVVAVDGSTAMLLQARRALHGAQVADRVELVEAILPGLCAGARRFDAAVSNSLLHHLRDPAVLWSEIAGLTRGGAPVLVVDLFRPTTRAAARDIVEAYAGSEGAILKTDFYNSLCAAFTLDEVAAQLRAAGLAPTLRVEQISDRHLAVYGKRP